jgi:hypothetical protein
MKTTVHNTRHLRGVQRLDVLAIAAGRFGKIDMACPLCGPFCKSPVNRRRKTLRIWRHDPDFATWFQRLRDECPCAEDVARRAGTAGAAGRTRLG